LKVNPYSYPYYTKKDLPPITHKSYIKMKTGDYNKILVIDDDIDIGNILKMILQHQGFNVFFLENAYGIKEIMKENDINLLILDMLLTSVNGTEVCADIKKDPSIENIPVLMISAHPGAMKTCIDAGANDFMSKPFTFQDMLLKINNLIPKHNSPNKN